ncbi:MAG: Fic family protein, partial [Eubacterium sp.]|nr:Fic family protein [Eubacterium sp.]
SLRQRAIIESVKGSNAIEGIVTTDDRIREIINGAVPVTHDEKEISGYKDALNIIHTNYANMDIDEGVIRMFHRLIEEGTNVSHAGEYKKTSNFIMEYNETYRGGNNS